MRRRKPVFPHVLEMNYQAGHIIGCNVYLLFSDDQWILVDIGYQETVDEIVDMIRELDFPLSQCQLLVATHADVDHIQGLAKAKQMLRAPVGAHPLAAQSLKSGDKLKTFAEIEAQGISMEMPPVEVDQLLHDGDVLRVGGLEVEVWLTPGHTDSQLSLRIDDLLLSGDNIYRDGCVGAIDAHHGSDIGDFIGSLRRIRDSDVQWLLPSHGPIFRKDSALLNATIERLQQYQHMADFGTCASDWPLMDQWERELAEGVDPTADGPSRPT